MKNKQLEKLSGFLNWSRFLIYSRQLLIPASICLLLIGGARVFTVLLNAPLPAYYFLQAVLIAGLLFDLIFVVKDLPLSDGQTARWLVDKSDRYEPLRALLCRSDDMPVHPAIEQKLIEEVNQIVAVGPPAQGVFSPRELQKIYVSLFVLLITPPLARLPVASLKQDLQPPGWELELSSQVVLSGDTITVTLSGEGETAIPELQIFSSASPEKRKLSWDKTEPPRWQSFSLREPVSFQLTSGAWQSPVRQVDVVSSPRFSSFKVKITPPSYTRLPESEVSGSEVEALPGSRLSIAVEADRSMHSLWIEDSGGRKLKEMTARRDIDLFERLTEPQIYKVAGIDTYGFELEPRFLQVELQENPRPTLQLISPEPDAAVEGEGLQPVRVAFRDKFGLSRALIKARTAAGRSWESEVPVPDNQPEGELYAQIDCDALQLLPGEEFEFEIIAWDNNNFDGPRYTTLGPIKLQVHTWAEMMARQEQHRMRGMSILDQLEESIGNLRKELDEMLRSGAAGDWETARKLQDIQERLEDKQESLQQARESIQQYQQSSPGLSSESLNRLQQIQNMIDEYGLESLRQAQDAVDRSIEKHLNEQEFAEQDLQFSSDQLKEFEEDIKRTHDFLENYGSLLEMERMAETLNEMAAEQAEIMESGEWGTDQQNRLERQAQQWDWMEDKLQKLAGEVDPDAARELEKLADKIAELELSRQARSLAQESESGNDAMQKYNQMTAEMQRAMQETLGGSSDSKQQQMRSLRETIVDYWTMWFAHLQNWSRHVNTMEVPPRFLAQFADQLEPLDKAIEGSIEIERGWRYLARLTRGIASMDLEFPREILQQLDDQQQRIQATRRRIQDRQIGAVRRSLPQVITAQSRLIMLFLDWEGHQQPGGEGGEGGEGSAETPSLSDLLSQQRGLSGRTMPFFGGEAISPELARQFARQQQMIRQGLQQFANNQAQSEDFLGDLDELSSSMREASEKMGDGEFDRHLQDKQQEIISRLEQATRTLSDDSTREEEMTRRRESRPGEDGPTAVSPSEFHRIMENLRDDLSVISPARREAVIRFYRFWYRLPDEERVR